MLNILESVKRARELLRSTQINWQEDCLFECDVVLSEIVAALEPAPVPADEWIPPVSISRDGKVTVDWKKPNGG
jgi:hypothetical protein